jgi:DNA-binding response OmpR family regulator
LQRAGWGSRGTLGLVSSPAESAAGGHAQTLRGDAETLRAGELEVRLADGLVLAGGQVLTLSVREFELLVALARRLGTIVRRDELFRTVWGGELRRGDRSVDVYVSKLRSKLEKAMPDRRYIHTHPGFGYRFQPQPSPRPHAAGAKDAGSADGGENGRGEPLRNVHTGVSRR